MARITSRTVYNIETAHHKKTTEQDHWNKYEQELFPPINPLWNVQLKNNLTIIEDKQNT